MNCMIKFEIKCVPASSLITTQSDKDLMFKFCVTVCELLTPKMTHLRIEKPFYMFHVEQVSE